MYTHTWREGEWREGGMERGGEGWRGRGMDGERGEKEGDPERDIRDVKREQNRLHHPMSHSSSGVQRLVYGANSYETA